MYALYIPIFIAWMVKAKDENLIRRILVPAIAIVASAFMIYATVLAHGIACVWYLIVFAVFMLLGAVLKNPKNKTE